MPRETSLTERAYQRLRDDLLTARLAPGDRINIRELADTMGFSLGAVREALSRLTSEGFVVADERRGFRAAPMSIREMMDLVAVRTEVESQCLRRAISKGDLEWEARIVSAAHRLSRTPVYADGPERRLNDDYATAHAAFHEALVSACDSPWLQRIRAWLYAQSERYRHLTVPHARAERNLIHEHGALAEAALARDADRATALLAEHLMATARVLFDADQAETGLPQQPTA